MIKKILGLAIALAFLGCGNKEDAKTAEQSVVKTDTVSKKMVGADEDAHGCKASAGYTWSVLRGECVRLFEKGTRLDAYENRDNSVMSAFVIFKEDKAELFIQTEKPMILTRKSEGDSFVNGKWDLVPWKGFVLKKDGKILFTGK